MPTVAALALAACDAPAHRDTAPDQADLAGTTPAGAINAAASPPPPAAAEPRATPVLAIEGEGLRLFDADSGAARALPFGMAQAELLRILGMTRGPGELGRLEECGAGPLDSARWDDGLTVYFQDGKLVGWAIGERAKGAPTTAAGIGIGSSRVELEAAYSTRVAESSLGTEFQAGDLFGILEGNSAKSRITDLWGGTSCNFR